MKFFALLTFILIQPVFAQDQAQDKGDLIHLSAGHRRDASLPKEENQVIYTTVVKSNQLSLKIWENIHQGQDFKKTYPLIDKSQVKELNPYIVKECLESNHSFILAGDIYHFNKYYFEGIVVGIPEDLHRSLYLCSIKKNNGLRSSEPNRELGPFELAYRKVKGLNIRNINKQKLSKHMLR